MLFAVNTLLYFVHPNLIRFGVNEKSHCYGVPVQIVILKRQRFAFGPVEMRARFLLMYCLKVFRGSGGDENKK